MGFRFRSLFFASYSIFLFLTSSSSAQTDSQSEIQNKPKALWRVSASLGTVYGESLGKWFEPSDGGINFSGALTHRLGEEWGLRLHFAQGTNPTGLIAIPVYDQFGGYLGLGTIDSKWKIGRYTLGCFGQFMLNKRGFRTDYFYVSAGFGIMTAKLETGQGSLQDGTPFTIVDEFNETYPLAELSSGVVIQVSGPLSMEVGGDASLAGVRGAFTVTRDDDIDAGYASFGLGLVYHFLQHSGK